ncbi:MAG TPA: thioesterase domain-containing protein, partial [Candidatus Nanopelagicales bacterium]|nr:thioesterase domain-containing protein [Candidatus Nanopelagicales bacterium]
NHLGRFRSEIDSPLGLRFVREDLGPFEAAQGTRSHVLAMNSVVADDCLEISLGYSRDLHDDATIERLAGELVATIGSLVHHGLSPDAHGISPLLLPIRTRGARPPVFCVGGFGADASYLHSLGPSLGEDQPFYAIQPIDLREEMPELDSMEALGERLADIIQRVQPAGPYTLSGHSGGACLALAIAFVLEARGHRTALAVLDMSAPTGAASAWDREDEREMQSLMSYVRQLKRNLGDALPLDVEAVAQMPDSEVWQHVGDILQREQLLPAGSSAMFLRRLVRVRQRIFQVLSTYMPKERYRGRLVLLSVAEKYSAGRSQVSAEGWQELCAHPIQAFEAPGNHMSMIREPHARVIAEHLRRLVDENAEPAS